MGWFGSMPLGIGLWSDVSMYHYMHVSFFVDTIIFFFSSSFSLDDKKYENESALPKNASDPEQVRLQTGFL